ERSTRNAIRTRTWYSVKLLFWTTAFDDTTSTLSIPRSVLAASLTASRAASLQLFLEVPTSSSIFRTAVLLTSSLVLESPRGRYITSLSSASASAMQLCRGTPATTSTTRSWGSLRTSLETPIANHSVGSYNNGYEPQLVRM